MHGPLRPVNGLWSVVTPQDAVPLSFLDDTVDAADSSSKAHLLDDMKKLSNVGSSYRPYAPGRAAADNLEIDEVFFDYNETGKAEAIKPRRHFMAERVIPEIPLQGVTTLYDVFQHTCSKYNEKNAFGQRPLIKLHVEKKEVVKVVGDQEHVQIKEWSFPEYGPYKYWTFSEAREVVSHIGAGLRHLGMQPGGKLSIFAPTSVFWFFMAYGAFTQSITITTAYETLGWEGLAHSLTENDASVIFTHVSQLKTVAKAQQSAPGLKIVIYYGDLPEGETKRELESSVRLVPYHELVSLGEKGPLDHVPPSRKDVACIMYTSGSTGMPKGVVMLHSTIVGSIAGVVSLLDQYIDHIDTYLAYLPLAHVLEFTVEACLFSMGLLQGYGSPRSLTDASVRNCKGDLRELRPTIMCGVPQVWETIKKGVLTKLEESSKLASTVFWAAFKTKRFCLERGIPVLPSIVDSLIFKKVKEATGGRLRYALSGGAAIHAETHSFLNTLLCPIFQGYGMTETCGTISMQNPDIYNKPNNVGHPFLCTEFTIVSVPDTDYSVRNKPHPQGELWVRGANVMHSYYKQEELNCEVRSKKGGWLKTGDIVELLEDGTIRVIDRRKSLFKLANGEYIAIEKLESIYKSAKLVQNLCITASSSCNKPIALVVPVHRELERLADKLNLDPSLKDPKHLHALCNNKSLVNGVLKNLVELGVANKFSSPELIGGVILVDDEWTSENGMLTPAQKLRRSHITKHYNDRIEKVYAEMRS